MNIILIGYRATGKTSVGRKLAEKRGMPFYDTDVLLVERLGKTIKEWVEERGWDSFRKEEKAVIRKIPALAPAVFALGGGAVLDPENREVIKENGPVIWLTAGAQTIIGRMMADPGDEDMRPRFSAADRERETQEILSRRLPLYRQTADLIVDTEGKTIEDLAEEIIRKTAG
jgi:shikimate kinase